VPTVPSIRSRPDRAHPDLDLDSLGLSRSGRIICLALQEYGAYVGDYSGAMSLYAENSQEAQNCWAGGEGVFSFYNRYRLPATADPENNGV
jgi:hypothetical protein